MARSPTCHGPTPDRIVHAPGCRPGRPRCRFRRRLSPTRRVCVCDAYLFPHRKGSGYCGNECKLLSRYVEKTAWTALETRVRARRSA